MSAREVHELAMLALRHFAAHGDSTLMTRLVQSLETSTWRTALIQWCERHARIRWIKGRNGFRGGLPKEGVQACAAERAPFRMIRASERAGDIGIRVDILWSTPYASLRPCRLCGLASLPGEDMCFRHHNK
jgi:hypothetical protein